MIAVCIGGLIFAFADIWFWTWAFPSHGLKNNGLALGSNGATPLVGVVLTWAAGIVCVRAFFLDPYLFRTAEKAALDITLDFSDGPAAMRDPITGELAEPILKAKDNRGLPGIFTYYRASSGLVFLDPVPANLGDYYADGYQQIPKDEAELAEMAKGDAYRLDFLKRLNRPPATFLEIGPWIGLTAYSAKKVGYDVSVLERSPECCALLESVGITATQTEDPAETLRSSGKTYDIIGMWHSIEHLPRPWEVIDAAMKALNPGGVILIAAPNPESAQMKVLGHNWLHLDAPRHLHFLPISMIQEIGEANGLATIDATTDDTLGRRIDMDGWNYEALRRFNVPIWRRFYRMLVAPRLSRKHRKSELDGAGYTVIMGKVAR